MHRWWWGKKVFLETKSWTFGSIKGCASCDQEKTAASPQKCCRSVEDWTLWSIPQKLLSGMHLLSNRLRSFLWRFLWRESKGNIYSWPEITTCVPSTLPLHPNIFTFQAAGWQILGVLWCGRFVVTSRKQVSLARLHYQLPWLVCENYTLILLINNNKGSRGLESTVLICTTL